MNRTHENSSEEGVEDEIWDRLSLIVVDEDMSTKPKVEIRLGGECSRKLTGWNGMVTERLRSRQVTGSEAKVHAVHSG